MNWLLAIITFLFAIGPAVVNATQYRFPDLYSVSAIQEEMFSISARTTLIVADILVIVVTVYSTWKGGSRRLGISGRLSLADILLYNGIKYFIVLLGLNIAAVVMAHLTVTSGGQSYITPVSEPLTAIFICHFLIDLQSANRGSMALEEGSPESVELADQGGTLRFASRMIGSLGGSARPEWDDADADDISGTYEEGWADSGDGSSRIEGTSPTGDGVEEKGGNSEVHCNA
ncbi:hypothetical protein C8Q78DRAFT_373800 [Trametes maxima]|nr:hypothetical protein C8Q78DRAFT_373800 [Trametes maxima]